MLKIIGIFLDYLSGQVFLGIQSKYLDPANVAGKSQSKSVLIGAYYKPHELDQSSFVELEKSLNLVNQSNSQICLLGDFNLPKIAWQLMRPTNDCTYQSFCSGCLEAFSDCLLEQIVTSPIRSQNILDLFFTTIPTLVSKVQVLPGWSDHDIVLSEVNSSLELKQAP